MRIVLGLLAVLCVSTSAHAQSCPRHDSEGGDDAADASLLHGTLVHHNELREWLGLKLDRPACGQNEIELVFYDSSAWRRADSFRGCGLTVVGKLYDSPTGYYSSDMAIEEGKLKPDSSCHPFPVRPDPSTTSIPKDLRTYRASITVDFRGKGRVVVKVWNDRDPQVSLRPWEAYVDYMLTGGGDIIRFDCRKGFQARDISQQPKSHRGLLNDVPDFPSVGLVDLNGTNTISFTCQRGSG